MLGLTVQISAGNRGDTVYNLGASGSAADQIAAAVAAASQPGVEALQVDYFESGRVRRIQVVSDPTFAARNGLNDNEISFAPRWLENDLVATHVIDSPVRYLPERIDDPVVDVVKRRRRPTGTPHPGPAEELAWPSSPAAVGDR